MADLRRYTGTKSLQYAWTALLVLAVSLTVVLHPAGATALTDRPLVAGGVGAGWLLGLVLLGLRDRRHWRRLVKRSSFESGKGPGRADLQRLYRGHSITVQTDVPGVLSQAHTEFRTNVEGVDADFTIKIEYVGGNAGDRGPATGNPDLDERFVFGGATSNLEKVLTSADVQAALMDIDTPGTMTITGEFVRYEVPFTRLSPNELGTITEALTEICARLEKIGQGEPDAGTGRGSRL